MVTIWEESTKTELRLELVLVDSIQEYLMRKELIRNLAEDSMYEFSGMQQMQWAWVRQLKPRLV